MANERALGISFIYAAQARRQLDSIFGETGARTVLGLTNVLVVFGGGKDGAFNKEISDLVGTTRVTGATWQLGRGGAAPPLATTSSPSVPRRSGNSPNARPS